MDGNMGATHADALSGMVDNTTVSPETMKENWKHAQTRMDRE